MTCKDILPQPQIDMAKSALASSNSTTSTVDVVSLSCHSAISAEGLFPQLYKTPLHTLPPPQYLKMHVICSGCLEMLTFPSLRPVS